MKFRIWTILWVFALFASALATFNIIYATVFAVCITYTWGIVLQWPRRPGLPLTEIAVLLCVWGLVWALLNPAISRSYEPERVADCHSKMTRIAAAVLYYREAHNRLPENGRRSLPTGVVHSWRTLIHPQLNTRDEIYEYDLSKPWNGPANLSIAQEKSPNLCCKNDSPRAKDGKTISTSYFAITGPRTAWRALSSPEGNFKDDPRTTILLIEQLESGVAWTEPQDLDFEAALALLTADPSSRTNPLPHHWALENRFFMRPPTIQRAKGLHVAFADGSVRFIPLPLSKEFATALLTANGGEQISEAEFAKLWKPEPDYARIYAFTVFVLLSLLPALNLRKKRQNGQSEAT